MYRVKEKIYMNGKIQDPSHLASNVSPSNHIANDGEEVLPIKADTILRANTNNVEAEAKVSPAVDIRKQVVNPANSQQISNPEEITKQVSPELTEESSTKRPIYNANQYSEVKRNETSYRNDRAPINLQSYDNSSEIKPSELASRISQNFDNQLDVSDSVNKSQSISHEGKPLANTNIAHNPQTSTAASDPISALNKLTTLDKPTTQLSANSQVNNGDELAQQITWAKNSNTNHVKIALAPEHLGALEITIDQDSDGLNIQFTTQNTLAKDAIETFMPRLKEMLEQQGLNLQNANVSQENNGNHSDAYSQEGEQYNIDNVQEGVQIASNSEQDIDHASSNNYLLEAFA